MTKSRTFLAALCGIFLAGPALANACLRPEERSALDIRALRTYLMVTALNCQKGESYNQFIRRFTGELGAAERAAVAHFTRSFGGRGRTQLDGYNTEMANEHSEDAIRSGTFFCRDADPLFRQALATPGADLAKFAAERNIPQTYTAAECTAAAAAPARRTARR
ncbi:hypothetical protein [Roseomonas sp. HF4]|uniref:hypothetical protein n=1 Tax=Roseomonas sp. HF4 TaxID=2562313 RepID=UPI0010C037C9|nr:hypothetical protein [Roseomonas sp. HF4]